MIKKDVGAIVTISLGELGVDPQGESPQFYYYNIPSNGFKNGINSSLSEVDINIDNPLLSTIEIPLTEKPIFLHFKGERSCPQDDDPTSPPSECGEVTFQTIENESSCSSISYKIIVDADCDLDINLSSFVGSIGSVEDGEDPLFTIVENVELSASNEIIVTVGGLSPSQNYNFSFGFEYSFDGAYGFVGGESEDFQTTSDNCFSDLTMSIGSYVPNCQDIFMPVVVEIPASYSEEELSNLLISTTLFEIYDNGDYSPADNMADIPFLDWNQLNTGNNPVIWEAMVELIDLSPNTLYEIHYSLEDNSGIVFLPSQTQNISIDPDGDVNIQCDFNIPKVCDVDFEINENGTYNICFDQVMLANGEPIVKYRLDIHDSNNNSSSTFGSFQLNDVIICFNDLDLSGLTSAPIILQVVTFNNDDQNVKGCRIKVPLDCEQNVVSFGEIRTYAADCRWASAYAKICIDEGWSHCERDYELSFRVLSNPSASLQGLVDIGNGCYLARFPRPDPCRPFVKNNFGTMSVLAMLMRDGQEIASEMIIWDYPECICPDPTMIPPISYVTNPGNIFEDNGRLQLSTPVSPELLDILKKERGDRPVYYAITRNSNPELFIAHEYQGRINLSLNESTFDPKEINSDYNIHVLVGDTFYNLEFNEEGDGPKDRRSQVFSGLEIFPNPSNGKITIRSEKEISRIEIIDINGRILKSLESPTNLLELDLFSHPGINFLRIININEIQVKKIIIQ